MKILILEDDSYRITTFIEKFCAHDLSITENAVNAIEFLKKNEYDYIFLDNDLGTGNGEGVEVAAYLRDNPKNPNNKATIIIHSWNNPASERIKNMLCYAKHVPFNSSNFFAINIDK